MLANQFSPSHRQARSSQASKGKPESCGVLGNSHIPDINGAETFAGTIFHAGHWDHAVSDKGITVSGYPYYIKINGPNTGAGHSSKMFYMQVVTDYIVQAVRA